jgi:integrase/recombinase XerD
MSEKPINGLRRRMLEDMAVRKFGEKTRHDYIRHVEAFARFLGRSPDTAAAEDVRRFQVHLRRARAVTLLADGHGQPNVAKVILH